MCKRPPVQLREGTLVKILANRVQPFLDGNTESFEKEIHKEADRLAAIPFGVPLLHIIGCGLPSPAVLVSSTTHLCAQIVEVQPLPGFSTCRTTECDFCACRYAYARAARPKLGHAVEEWFTRVMHSLASQARPHTHLDCPVPSCACT